MADERKKGRKGKIFLWLLLAAAAVLAGCLAAGWGSLYGGQNPLTVERAKASLAAGRDYEVLEENRVFLTDAEHIAGLVYFIEGHYGVRYASGEEDTVRFAGDLGEMRFRLIPIRSFRKSYWIWERVD